MKDPIIGHDNLGLPIYKTLKKHRSMSILGSYCVCEHHCITCYRNWSHKISPDLICSVFWLWSDCEGCLTYGFNVSKKDKLKLFTERQRDIVTRWAKKHGVKING